MRIGFALRTSTVYAAREPLVHFLSWSRVRLPLDPFHECRLHQFLLWQSHLVKLASGLDNARLCWTGGLLRLCRKRRFGKYVVPGVSISECIQLTLDDNTQGFTAECTASSVSRQCHETPELETIVLREQYQTVQRDLFLASSSGTPICSSRLTWRLFSRYRVLPVSDLSCSSWLGSVHRD